MRAFQNSSRRVRLLVAVGAVALVAPLATVVLPSAQAQQHVFTYSVDTRGDIESDVGHFRRVAADTFAHERGWNLGGSVAFREVASGGDFILWLASPAAVDAFHPVCSKQFSCRVGDNVIINDEAWAEGTDAWTADVATYRQMILNHEVGHWLGLDHTSCPASGKVAPIMQQQSIDLEGCLPNPFPTDEERQRVGRLLGAPILFQETVSFAPSNDGYWVLEQDGEALHFGDATDFGDVLPLATPTDMDATLSRNGYWSLDELGGVHTAGDAPFHGSIPGLRNEGHTIGFAREVGIEGTPTDDGYWILDEFGGVFSLGDADFHGSVPGLINAGARIGEAWEVAIASTPDGGGYWILDEQGGVFAFGNARFHGSIPQRRDQGAEIDPVPIVDIAATPSGSGYWILDQVGGIHAFGDAVYRGSVPDGGPGDMDVAVEMAVTATGNGYWIVDRIGRVATFGDASDHGQAA